MLFSLLEHYLDTDTALKVSQSVYCFTTSISHGVENYFPRLWGSGISDAIFVFLLWFICMGEITVVHFFYHNCSQTINTFKCWLSFCCQKILFSLINAGKMPYCDFLISVFEKKKRKICIFIMDDIILCFELQDILLKL